MRDWKLVVGGAGLALLLLGGCTATLSSADRAKLDEAVAASEKAAANAEAAAQKAMDAVQKAEISAMKAEEAAAQAQMNADLSKKAFETGLKK